jgi:hypothetical protein
MHSLDASVLRSPRESFPNREAFTSSEGTFTAAQEAACGLSWAVTCLSVRRRVGWELHIRLNGMVGVRLGI